MKQFNEEYKEYVNTQAPDLWDRIEEGVDQKISSREISLQENNKRKRTRKKTRMIRFFGSVAACVAALIIAVPVLRMVKQSANGGKDFSMQELADVTIENSEEVAQAVESGRGDMETAAGVSDAEVVSETVEEIAVAEGACENEENDGATEEQLTQELVDEALPDAVENEDFRNYDEVAALSEKAAKDENANSESVLDEMEMDAQQETIVARVVRVCEVNGDHRTVYEIEVISDCGKTIKATQILRITALEQVPALEPEATYTMSVKDVDEEQMTAILYDIVQ